MKDIHCTPCGTTIKNGQHHSSLRPKPHQYTPIREERLSAPDLGRPLLYSPVPTYRGSPSKMTFPAELLIQTPEGYWAVSA